MKNLMTAIFLCIASLVFSQTDSSLSLSACALELTKDHVIYDPSYFSIEYPNGDIPASKGVCTDVIIRAYRKKGVDLQKLVHEDMVLNFKKYPNIWGLRSTDKNIDHRRVPNLMAFFSRFGTTKPNSNNPSDYTPGDIVCWSLGNGLTHIGIVVRPKSQDNKRHLIVHNIGNGQVLEDCLFNYNIIGHYQFH